MKKVHYSEIEKQIPDEKGIKDVTIRWLITKDDGAENFAMRLFEVQPSGFTPLHQHDWEHEVFILDGIGELRNKEKATSFRPGDVVFVPSNEWHQFVNTGSEVVKFLCLIAYKN